MSEQVAGHLIKRQGDTWLTCLKFLIPFYALYYLIDRRTITPWVTGFLFAIPIAIIVQSADTRAGVNVKSEDYYDMTPGLSYLLSPLTMGIGAMKAKRYAKRLLLQSDVEETE